MLPQPSAVSVADKLGQNSPECLIPVKQLASKKGGILSFFNPTGTVKSEVKSEEGRGSLDKIKTEPHQEAHAVKEEPDEPRVKEEPEDDGTQRILCPTLTTRSYGCRLKEDEPSEEEKSDADPADAEGKQKGKRLAKRTVASKTKRPRTEEPTDK